MISFDTPGLGKRAGIAVCGLVVAAALAGCGAGQVSQVATQEPAVNGTAATFDHVALRNVHLQAVETGDALEAGREIPLIFLAANNSPDKTSRLVDITTDVGKVSLSGPRDLAPNGVLVVGAPDGVTALSEVEKADAGEATVTLTEPVRNGLTYDFTFTFDTDGQRASHTLAVPISAGNAPRQSGDGLGAH